MYEYTSSLTLGMTTDKTKANCGVRRRRMPVFSCCGQSPPLSGRISLAEDLAVISLNSLIGQISSNINTKPSLRSFLFQLPSSWSFCEPFLFQNNHLKSFLFFTTIRFRADSRIGRLASAGAPHAPPAQCNSWRRLFGPQLNRRLCISLSDYQFLGSVDALSLTEFRNSLRIICELIVTFSAHQTSTSHLMTCAFPFYAHPWTIFAIW